MHIFSILKPILSNLSLTLPTRVFHDNMFFYEKKNWLNPLCKYLEVTLKESKRIFDVDNF